MLHQHRRRWHKQAVLSSAIHAGQVEHAAKTAAGVATALRVPAAAAEAEAAEAEAAEAEAAEAGAVEAEAVEAAAAEAAAPAEVAKALDGCGAKPSMAGE